MPVHRLEIPKLRQKQIQINKKAQVRQGQIALEIVDKSCVGISGNYIGKCFRL